MRKVYLGLAFSLFVFGILFAQDVLKIEKLSRLYSGVMFTHEKHMEIAGGDCKKCHHFSGDKTPPCSACHTKDGKGNIKVSLRDAYHGQCVGCHKEMAGPVKCRECHGSPVKKYDILNLSSIQRLYKPVSFSHGKHIDLVGDCKVCHHMDEGITYTCSPCHPKEDVYKYDGKRVTVGLKGAYHGTCIGCHKKMGKGPLKCTSCHERVAKK